MIFLFFKINHRYLEACGCENIKEPAWVTQLNNPSEPEP